jgi:adenylyltransferase/sulfurtransferase
VPEITVGELKGRIGNGDKISVLDVREPHEYEVANIGARLIPLAELPERLVELDQDGTLAVHCKTGGRSARAVQFLQEAGFQNVYNVKGGIDAWSEEIDPSVPKY